MRTVFGANRRLIAICTSVLALSIIAFVTPRVSGPALAESDGSAYTVPLVVDVNPDPDVVETTIIAQAAGVDIGNGVDVSVLTFNGTIPGPEFRLKVGDTVIVHFVNKIAHATGIHWHGIELANASDGTPLTQNQVAPGDTFLYKFKVTRPGHLLVSPASSLVDQPGLQGLYGSIIVDRSERGAARGRRGAAAAGQTRGRWCSATSRSARPPAATTRRPTIPSLPHVSGSALLAAGPAASDDTLRDGRRSTRTAMPAAPFAAGDVPEHPEAGRGRPAASTKVRPSSRTA